LNQVIFRFAFVFVSILCLLSCGGGGGSSNSGSGSTQNGSTQNADQGVRIIHAALDFGPLAIFAASGSVAQARFADKSYHGFLQSSLQNLVLAPSANPAAPIWSSAVEISGGTRKSVFVYGGYKTQDLGITLLEDAPAIPEKSFAYVRFVNGLVSDSSAQVQIPTLVQTSAVGLGKASAYVTVPAGIYDFVVSSAGADVGRTNAVVKAGAAYSVVSHGAVGYLVSTSLLQD
jgi:hypothetical protein